MLFCFSAVGLVGQCLLVQLIPLPSLRSRPFSGHIVLCYIV